MNSLFALLAGVSASVVSVSGQYYDAWDCNHYSSYTVDLCYGVTSSYEYLATCNGTTSIVWAAYSDNTCGDTDAEPWLSVTYHESSDTLDVFACDQTDACDYVIIRLYGDDDCSGSSYVDVPYITGQCYQWSSSLSYEYSCSGNKFTSNTYSSEDCSGSSVTVSIDYTEYNDDISGCYEVFCSGGSGASSIFTAFGAFVAVITAIAYRLF